MQWSEVEETKGALLSPLALAQRVTTGDIYHCH